MSRHRIGSEVRYTGLVRRGHGETATVLSHGRDNFGAYTEIKFKQSGEVRRVHPSNLRKDKAS